MWLGSIADTPDQRAQYLDHGVDIGCLGRNWGHCLDDGVEGGDAAGQKPKCQVHGGDIGGSSDHHAVRAQILDTLLARNTTPQIAEAAVLASASNSRNGMHLVSMLLARNPNVEITEAGMVVLVKYSQSDTNIMRELLASNPNVKITEAILVAAARNLFHGKEMVQMRLPSNPTVQDTDRGSRGT